ncbi:MAG: Bro-N domain-containing protein [Candidatus Omnitrophica bacterium]|nr:Bro-N domain-containing protein [Candidatus Omnitrophota bacterium]
MGKKTQQREEYCMQPETKIAIFKGRRVRKILNQNEWYFSVVDVVEILSGSSIPRRYWSDLKKKLTDEGYSELYEKIVQLKLPSSDGKLYMTDCADTETMFRIIQSISSPKAEPFKRWLAKVGYERVQEIENPELATKRTRMLYKLKGYSDDWIEKRMRGIAIREELTDEWQKRGAQEEKDYEILTSEISRATFGVTPSEYKEIKGLKRENLRDHMDDLELIFTMLGERSSTEIHRNEDSKGVKKLKTDARAGGRIAGNARKELERRLKRPIVSRHNYLKEKETQKRIG